MRKLMRKRILVPVLAISALAVAGVAFAYFTSSGTGSGTATVGSDAGLTIDPVTITGTLYPGGAVDVDFTVNNSSADTSVHVDKVVVDSIVTPRDCDAADFSFDDVTLNADIAARDSASGRGSLAMANTSANQDACKGGTVTLNLKVSS